MTATPQAFLSYTRLDDQPHHDGITALRAALELQVRVVTGDDGFEIFQDVDGIAFGEHWPDRLDQALAASRFLIPVLSPRFFRSEPCRDELRKFLNHERDARRNDLILPIYWVQAPVLELTHLTAADDLAAAISERQRWDWRSHAQASLTNQTVKKAIRKLAEAIAGRLQLESPAPLANAVVLASDSDMPVAEPMGSPTAERSRTAKLDEYRQQAIGGSTQYNEPNKRAPARTTARKGSKSAREERDDSKEIETQSPEPAAEQLAERTSAQNADLEDRASRLLEPAKVALAPAVTSLDGREADAASASEVHRAEVVAIDGVRTISPPSKPSPPDLETDPARARENSDVRDPTPASTSLLGDAPGLEMPRRRAGPLRPPYGAGDAFRTSTRRGAPRWW